MLDILINVYLLSADENPKDYVEGIVCRVDELQENEMKICELHTGHVLLVKHKGQISAIGTKCTHYNAPLVQSALSDGRLRCQWHGACFNLTTGDIEDFPGLDSLPCYKVTVEDKQIKVRAKKSWLRDNIRTKPMATRNKHNKKHMVVVGGGPSGATCVEVLRQEGFEGQITLVCKENSLPYDRAKLSKAMDAQLSQLQLRTDKFYKDHSIDVLKGVAATALDPVAKTVKLSNNKVLKYDSLFVATGCKPRKLDIPGADLKNVMVLGNHADFKYANEQITSQKEVVIVGSGFIGMEVASYCVTKVKKVTIVARDAVPFTPILGDKIGLAILELYHENGINFIPKSGVTAAVGNSSGAVCEVQLVDGKKIRADIFIMAVGNECNNELLKDKGHYSLAHHHGKVAALNMLKKPIPLRAVPFFHTFVLGKVIRYAGYGSFNEVVYVGDVNEWKFVAFYLDKDEVAAACASGMDPIISQFAELLAQGKILHKKDLKGDPLKWRSWILT